MEQHGATESSTDEIRRLLAGLLQGQHDIQARLGAVEAAKEAREAEGYATQEEDIFGAEQMAAEISRPAGSGGRLAGVSYARRHPGAVEYSPPPTVVVAICGRSWWTRSR